MRVMDADSSCVAACSGFNLVINISAVNLYVHAPALPAANAQKPSLNHGNSLAP
jgi:hypothetical protein